MRVLSAIALLCFCLAPSVCAQHGGARGGFGSPAPVGGLHGGFAAPSRAGFGSAPRFGSPSAVRSPYGSGYGYRSAPRSYNQYPASGLRSLYGPSYGGLRVVPGHPRNVGSPRLPRVRVPWISPLYPFPGVYSYSFLDPFWGFDDNSFYDGSSSSYAPQDANAYAGQPSYSYPAQSPYSYDGQQTVDDPGPPSGGDGGPLVYAPYPYPSGPQVTVVQAPPTERQEDAITVFYKDGRPPEQIRDYALTRSTLLVTGQRIREIPLEELDLVTTERVNRAMGVDFRLPQAQ